MILGLYDSPVAVVTDRAIPPATSWWVGLTDEEFTVAARREFQERMSQRRLPPGIRNVLAEREAERRRGMGR